MIDGEESILIVILTWDGDMAPMGNIPLWKIFGIHRIKMEKVVQHYYQEIGNMKTGMVME